MTSRAFASGPLRQSFAYLERLTRSLLKQHPGKGSIAMKRRSCGWSDKFLMEIPTGIVPSIALAPVGAVG